MKQAKLSFAGRASNPVKASPAQLAARKRFAEMARSGAFKKTTKRKVNPGTSDATLANWIDRIASGQTYNETKLKEALQHPGVTAEDKIVIRAALKGAPYSHTDLNQAANNIRNKRKANPEPTHDFAKIGKPFAFDGRTWKVSQYAHTGKTIEAFTTDRKSPFRRETLDVAMLMGTRRKLNPVSGSNAGEFAMTVNGKTIHRFFVHTSDPWAKSHGFDYQLVSNVTKNGAFVKFTKTRAIVAVDEAADGSAVTEKWEIRNLVFYKTNPAKKTVSQKVSQLVHEGYPQRQAVAVALSEQRAGKVKRNPATKTQDIYFVSIMNQDGLQYGVDRRTPVTYTFSAKEPKKAYRSFGLPFNVTSNPKFQEFAKRNKTIVASLNEIIEMMQGFAK